MTSASDVVYYGPKGSQHPMDRLSCERLRSENMMVRSSHFGGEKTDITLLQGIGGYAKSGGTHLPPGGCYDTTAFNHANRMLVGRLLGGADWYRAPNWDNAGGGPHVHHNTIGGPANPAAKQQWTAYYADRNGLKNNAKDPGPCLRTKPLFVAPWTDRGARGVRYLTKRFTARAEGSTSASSRGALPKGGKFTVVAVVNVAGTLWGINKDGLHVAMSALTKTKPSGATPPAPAAAKALRVGTLNFPDKTKITTATEAARIKRAVAQINAAELDILAIQEGVGRAGPDTTSSLMSRLLTALGADWTAIVPTRDLNENYLLRRKSTTNSKQHPDVVLRGTLNGKALPGRHLTLATFDTAIGPVTVGDTQLVNDNRPGAEVQAGLAAAAVKSVGGSKRILLGDLNTSGPLKELTAAGMVSSREAAKTSSTRDAVTYTNQDKTKPSTNPFWLIDHVFVAGGLTVNGYTVVLDLDADGNFVQPRVGDHSLVIVSLS